MTVIMVVEDHRIGIQANVLERRQVVVVVGADRVDHQSEEEAVVVGVEGAVVN